jgi:hypothetical protein
MLKNTKSMNNSWKRQSKPLAIYNAMKLIEFNPNHTVNVGDAEYVYDARRDVLVRKDYLEIYANRVINKDK